MTDKRTADGGTSEGRVRRSARHTTSEIKRQTRQLDGILPEGIDRRKFLGTVIGGLAAGVAGCASGGGDGGDGGDGSDGESDSEDMSDSGDGGDGSDGESDGGDGEDGSGSDSGDLIQADAKFRGPWKAEPDWLIPYVAEEEDYWRERNIVEPDPARGYGSSDTSKRVGTGKLEFGVSSTVAQTNFLATADGAPFSMIGTDKPRAQTGLFYRADGPIENLPEDLDGGTVALTSNPFIIRSYEAWALLSGAPDNVEFIEGTEAVQLESLQSGEADAVLQTVGDIPDYEAALDTEIKFDPLYKYEPVYGYSIIVNDEFMENNMEYTTRVLEGYSHAMKWTMLNIEDALKILRQEVNPSLQVQELETQANALRISIITTAATQGYKENGAAYLNEEVVQKTLDVYGQVVEGGEVPDLTDAANFEPQENADLAQFSSDEWNQIQEEAGEFLSYFE